VYQYIKRKGYRTQTTTHNPTKQLDHTNKEKEKEEKETRQRLQAPNSLDQQN
jgi:hypothetical protein